MSVFDCSLACWLGLAGWAMLPGRDLVAEFGLGAQDSGLHDGYTRESLVVIILGANPAQVGGRGQLIIDYHSMTLVRFLDSLLAGVGIIESAQICNSVRSFLVS